MDKTSYSDVEGSSLSLEPVSVIEARSNFDMPPPKKDGWEASWKASYDGWVYIKEGLRRFGNAAIWVLKDIWFSFLFQDGYWLATTHPLNKHKLWFYGVADSDDGRRWSIEIALPVPLPRKACVGVRIRARPLGRRQDRQILEQGQEKIPLGALTLWRFYDTKGDVPPEEKPQCQPSSNSD